MIWLGETQSESTTSMDTGKLGCTGAGGLVLRGGDSKGGEESRELSESGASQGGGARSGCGASMAASTASGFALSLRLGVHWRAAAGVDRKGRASFGMTSTRARKAVVSSCLIITKSVVSSSCSSMCPPSPQAMRRATCARRKDSRVRRAHTRDVEVEGNSGVS